MTAPRAADLPPKSRVRAAPHLGNLWKHPSSPAGFPWFCPLLGDDLSDEAVQQMLDDRSAQVLRVGDGSDQ
jgi:hypothetical protein